jgi:hypothetical protein
MSARSLEVSGESVQHGSGVRDDLEQRERQNNDVIPVLKAYVEERTDLWCYLRWRLCEGPSRDVCARFHRAQPRIVPKAVLSGKLWYCGEVLRSSYQMELPVLVRVVPRAQTTEPEPRPSKRVVPTYVWLKVLESAPIPNRKAPDPVTVQSPAALVFVDRELRRPLHAPWNIPAEMPYVQFVSKVIKGRASIKQNLATD